MMNLKELINITKDSNCDYAVAYVNAGIEELKILQEKNLVDEPAKEALKKLVKEIEEIIE
jgi:hypothetical protein